MSSCKDPVEEMILSKTPWMEVKSLTNDKHAKVASADERRGEKNEMGLGD